LGSSRVRSHETTVVPPPCPSVPQRGACSQLLSLRTDVTFKGSGSTYSPPPEPTAAHWPCLVRLVCYRVSSMHAVQQLGQTLTAGVCTDFVSIPKSPSHTHLQAVWGSHRGHDLPGSALSHAPLSAPRPTQMASPEGAVI